MLTTLRIKNLALVADLALELQSGFNAITGETGAGKSIIMGALNLVLGERADRTLIRSGSDSCSVEAVFDVAQLRVPLKDFLEENGLEACEENQLVLKRTFTAAGANRQFVNGSPTSLSALGAIGAWLVDMHGPHDHQSLLHPSQQLSILDAFGTLRPLRQKFEEILRRRTVLETEKASLIIDEKTYAQQLDLLRFQVNEIKAARLKPEDDAGLEQEYARAGNAAKLLELSQSALGVLSEDENSLLTQSGALGRFLQDLQRLDPGAAGLAKLQTDVLQTLRELQNEISHYADRIDVNPERLRELEERLNLLQSLKRKYGSTIEEVIVFGDAAQKKLQNLEQRETELARIQQELKRVEEELWRAGGELSTARKKVIPKLSKAVVRQLNDLGFKQSGFDVSLATASKATVTDGKSAFSASGLDTIEFLFTPNPGEPARPLRAIASSGEMARVMLALKTVLAAEDEIPVLVFDEVDANVGGETANVVGTKMRQIAQRRQVLCITHLAQVAACASAHYVVRKETKAGRTISEIGLLSDRERVEEIARMLGGQSDPARKHAQALLKAAT